MYGIGNETQNGTWYLFIQIDVVFLPLNTDAQLADIFSKTEIAFVLTHENQDGRKLLTSYILHPLKWIGSTSEQSFIDTITY